MCNSLIAGTVQTLFNVAVVECIALSPAFCLPIGFLLFSKNLLRSYERKHLLLGRSEFFSQLVSESTIWNLLLSRVKYHLIGVIGLAVNKVLMKWFKIRKEWYFGILRMLLFSCRWWRSIVIFTSCYFRFLFQ